MNVVGVEIAACRYKHGLAATRMAMVRYATNCLNKWASTHNVGGYSIVVNFKSVTVVFKEESDYTLLALTWEGNYKFLYSSDNIAIN